MGSKNRLLLLRKDGSRGEAFDIKKDLKFGRFDARLHSSFFLLKLPFSDHPANIRIKSSSIALEHAVIQVSQEDQSVCLLFFLYSGSSSPPLVLLFSVISGISRPPTLQRSTGNGVGENLFGCVTKMSSPWVVGPSFSSQVPFSLSPFPPFSAHCFAGDPPGVGIADESMISLGSELTLITAETAKRDLSAHSDTEKGEASCGYLCILNRDGSERPPFLIRASAEVFFGRSLIICPLPSPISSCLTPLVSPRPAFGSSLVPWIRSMRRSQPLSLIRTATVVASDCILSLPGIPQPSMASRFPTANRSPQHQHTRTTESFSQTTTPSKWAAVSSASGGEVCPLSPPSLTSICRRSAEKRRWRPDVSEQHE
jgi:hypothetical protein